MRIHVHMPQGEGRSIEMAQWVEALAGNPDDMNLIPRIYLVEGDN